MGITVAVKVEHLPIANALVAAPASEKSRTVLVPNLDYHGTVRDTLNAFISRNLFLPEECQLLSAPLFTRLSEKDSVDDIYKRYSCQVHTLAITIRQLYYVSVVCYASLSVFFFTPHGHT